MSQYQRHNRTWGNNFHIQHIYTGTKTERQRIKAAAGQQFPFKIKILNT
jgi:hypothetical protein